MATRPKAIIESRNGEKFSPITIAKNVLTDDGQNLHDILSDRKEDMMTPTIKNSSSMFKVGQGDNVDYSSNVVNGAYEDMVLKGKTMVNCIQESSSKDVVLPYEFADGQYVTINDTKESGALGVELKGQTLVNQAPQRNYWFSRQNSGWYEDVVETTNEVSFTITGEDTGWAYLNAGHVNRDTLKPNTKYLIVCEEALNISRVALMAGNATGRLSDEVNLTNNRAIITTYRELTNLTGQVFYFYIKRAVGNKVKLKNVMFIEYQDGMENWDIPYFTGMTSCKMPILKSVESLFDAQKIIPNNTFTYSHSTNIGRFEFTNRGDVVVNTNIQLPAGTYDISFSIRGVCDNGRAAITFAKDGEAWYGCSRTEIYYHQFGSTTFKEVKTKHTFDAPVTVTIVGHAWAGGATGSGWCEFKDIRFTPVGKSSILSLPEEVVLRSLPNGVCDTFNTRTGVYTQRIGEAIVNGSENWQLNNTEGTTTQRFFCSMLVNSAVDNNTKGTQQYLCDRLRTITWSQTCELGVTINGSGVFVYNNSIEYTVSSVKQWLSQNPVKLQYELATPVVTKINLSSTLKSWNTTTHIYSEIPENTLYPILSHSNPTYPVILKPSTKYSIIANSYSNNHTNSTINFNLGGATASTTVGNRVTTITTPSTLSNELLTMSGRGNKLNNVMVIEGDVVGDEPYFEGICDCKSPILTNVGKNLFDGVSYIDGFIASGNNYTVSYDADVTSILVNVNKNTDYTLSAKTSFNRSLVGGSLEPISIGTKTTNLNAERVSNTIKFNSGEYTNIIIYLNSSKIDIEDIQVEEGSASTSYEPYKSNILSCETYFDETAQSDKTIVLRSLPNGVCDTLNVETGEYVQNVVDIVLDGTENWTLNNWGTDDNFCSFEISSLNNTKIQNVYKKNSYIDFYCDTFKVLTNCKWNYMSEKHIRQWSDGNRTTISVIIPKTELRTYDVTGFIEYLTENNIRINIRANNPIVSTVDIQGFPHAYTNGHVLLSSGSIKQSLTPKVEYSVVTNRNGQIRSNQKMVERHQKQLDRLQAMILTNLVSTQYEQTLTNLKYDLKNVREEVK